jgi:hypothetical protein
MENLFVSYEQALQLKELGFNEPCFGRYYYKESYPMLNPNSGETELVFEFGQYIKQTEITILVPLYQQAFRWFRDNHNLFGCIDLQCSNPTYWYIRVDDIIENNFVYHSEDYHIKYKTYEEAEDACLDKLIEITKDKK